MLKYLLELRNKFILLVFTFLSTLSVCYLYKKVLLFLITQMHLNDKNLYFIFTDVTELFSVYFRLVLFFVIQINTWYFFYHLFFFLSPALYIYEFIFLKFCWISGTILWFLSGLLSAYILVPFGWFFFLSFQSYQGIYFEARINEYFSFYSNVYLLSLIYCQVFVLLFLFLVDIRLSSFYIKKYRKLYYYVFLLFATFVTPPDLLSQIGTTFGTIIIYEIILVLSIFNYFLIR